ncbi:hypothetical protein L484_023047 [Morus notabilis]|uniref:Uncharacterized protein n=1 Tax=Morus notabilis TaxID=981085 RepID=W9RVV9_9ROSA|nr:hypothetical protein L484_023047 [Morus notabilis]
MIAKVFEDVMEIKDGGEKMGKMITVGMVRPLSILNSEVKKVMSWIRDNVDFGESDQKYREDLRGDIHMLINVISRKRAEHCSSSTFAPATPADHSNSIQHRNRVMSERESATPHWNSVVFEHETNNTGLATSPLTTKMNNVTNFERLNKYFSENN